jgi:hypothetical protein
MSAIIPGNVGWPVATWILVVTGVVFLGRLAMLLLQGGRERARTQAVSNRLARAAGWLHERTQSNPGRLPGTPDELPAWFRDVLCYRPVPRLELDGRLIVVHDAAPICKVLEFPYLRDGRGVLFSSGRCILVSEAVFEKLIAADDELRRRLGLAPIGQRGEDERQDGG